MKRIFLSIIFLIVLVPIYSSAAFAQQNAVNIATTTISFDDGTMTIVGEHFDIGPNPTKVTLGGTELPIISNDGSTIVAGLPDNLEPGQYQLLVMSGPGPRKMDTQTVVVGAQGEQGDQGEQGEQGDQGLRGPPGPPGPIGPSGPIGPQGDTGAQGTKGDTGEKGDKGERGEAGKDGERGPEGPPGPRGLRGPPGDGETSAVLEFIVLGSPDDECECSNFNSDNIFNVMDGRSPECYDDRDDGFGGLVIQTSLDFSRFYINTEPFRETGSNGICEITTDNGNKTSLNRRFNRFYEADNCVMELENAIIRLGIDCMPGAPPSTDPPGTPDGGS